MGEGNVFSLSVNRGVPVPVVPEFPSPMSGHGGYPSPGSAPPPEKNLDFFFPIFSPIFLGTPLRRTFLLLYVTGCEEC